MKKTLFSLLVYSAAINAQVPSGAVGYWPFNNNALDMSGNGNNGTATNTIPYTDRFGNPNKAYKFNGVNSQIVVPNSSFVDIGPNEDFTFAIWEKAYNDNSDRAIVIKHLQGSWDGYWIGATSNPGYCNTPQHIDFYTASGGQQDACTDTGIMEDSTWHFITGVYKAASQKNYLYIDGVLQADSGGSSGVLSNTMDLCFGFCSCDNSHFFHGVLDDGRLYKKALNQTEILQLYHEPNSVTTVTTGLQEQTSTLSSFKLFPNPGTGLITLRSTKVAADKVIEVRNTIGQIILHQQLPGNTSIINLQDQPAGIYIISLRSAEGLQTLKFVKE